MERILTIKGEGPRERARAMQLLIETGVGVLSPKEGELRKARRRVLPFFSSFAENVLGAKATAAQAWGEKRNLALGNHLTAGSARRKSDTPNIFSVILSQSDVIKALSFGLGNV